MTPVNIEQLLSLVSPTIQKQDTIFQDFILAKRVLNKLLDN